MMLSKTKFLDLEVNQVQIHCYKDNLVSVNSIISDGGILESELVIDDKIVQKYVVTHLTSH